VIFSRAIVGATLAVALSFPEWADNPAERPGGVVVFALVYPDSAIDYIDRTE
jgi:hypothetical protein